MSEHTIVAEDETEHRWTVTCSCGNTYMHPKRDGAVMRWGTHLALEDARAALKGED